jgi:patatin-related protein
MNQPATPPRVPTSPPEPLADIGSPPRGDLPADGGGGPTREVRLAVVMYGGVSLAIYINGVAQELLRLVRATAPAPGDDRPDAFRCADGELSRVERVYRRLARLLDRDRIPGTDPGPDAPVRARFVVDILSGTSAGGINAIYLAKALANGQSISGLQDLWLAEADLEALINDGQSIRGLPLPGVESPESLLNSHRMYLKLLDAFDGMEPPAGRRRAPPLVQQVDLFVTATDIAGITVPLRLSDRTVSERRHRSVFHFAFEAGKRNDFRRKFNPLLAFAARATSAFPFAFEPMRLCDIDPVLQRHPRYARRVDCGSDAKRWQPFFADFAGSTQLRTTPVAQRSFGDGGYLDNKPFSHATETLLRREATIPVDRKLIYVEPAPEHPELDAPRARPDAIENVLAATVGLPRYETIREDLERLIDRNQLTERVRTLLEGIERDVQDANLDRMPLESTRVWAQRDLAEMVRLKGAAYGAYHRLRVAVATDWLAAVLARAAGYAEASAHRQALRYLLRAWRTDRYTAIPASSPPRETENQFLLDFDLDFRLRRMAHLLSRADVLHGYDYDARTLVELATGQFVGDGDLPDFRAELLAVKRELLPAHRRMQDEGAALRDGRVKEVERALSRWSLGEGRMLSILDPQEDAQREDIARALLRDAATRDALDDAVERVRTRLLAARLPGSRQAAGSLDPGGYDLGLSPGARQAREALWHFYRHFDDYDLVAFPILYTTEAGEQDTVEVVRISPEDAHSLIGARAGDARRKLAGTVFFNFGAFLDRVWRANDLLWGRLDAAERLISALLPHPDDDGIRRALVDEANRAILEEYLTPAARTEVSRLVVASLVSATSGEPAESAVRALVQRLRDAPLDGRLAAILTACLDEDEVLAHFAEAYEVGRDIDRPRALRTLARSAKVVGRMLESITARRAKEAPKTAWLTRSATVFWGLVEVAVPGGFPSLVWRHWLALLLAFEAALFLIGLVIEPGAARFALRAFAATALAGLAVYAVRDYMLRRATLLRLLAAAAVLALVALAAIGAARVFGVPLPDVQLARLGALSLGVRPVAGGLAAVLGVLIVLVPGLRLLFRPDTTLPGGFRLPVLAAELPATGRDLQSIAGDDRRRRAIVAGLAPDYVFIALYGLLFVLVGVMVAGAGGGVMLGLGAACAAAGVAAAVCDVAENVHLQRALGPAGAFVTDWMADAVRRPALAKWGLTFFATACGAPLFYRPGEPGALALGALWIVAAVLGLAGVARWRTLIQWAFLLLGVGLVGMAALFLL